MRKLHATMTMHPPSAADFDRLLEAHGAAWKRARALERAPQIHDPRAAGQVSLSSLESMALAYLLDPDRGWHHAKRLSVPEIHELAHEMAEVMRTPGGGGWEGALEKVRNVAIARARESADRAALSGGRSSRRVVLSPGGEPVDVPSKDASLADVAEWLKKHAPVANEDQSSLYERARQTRLAVAGLAGIDGPSPLLMSAWPGRTPTERVLRAMASRNPGARFDLAAVHVASALAHSGAAI